MQKGTREVLDLIDEALLRGDVVASELWDILTVLRGPDKEAGVPPSLEKGSTVGILRTVAFPRTGAKVLDKQYGPGNLWLSHSRYCPLFVEHKGEGLVAPWKDMGDDVGQRAVDLLGQHWVDHWEQALIAVNRAPLGEDTADAQGN